MLRSRRTARVFLFDPASRILLIHCIVPRPDGEFLFWLTPGGEIEPGETASAAAARELREELAIEIQVIGPVCIEANRFEHQGEMRDNIDFFFTATCAADAPMLAGVDSAEIALMREVRWWSAAEIEASSERFFPADLPAKIRSLSPEIESHPN